MFEKAKFCWFLTDIRDILAVFGVYLQFWSLVLTWNFLKSTSMFLKGYMTIGIYSQLKLKSESLVNLLGLPFPTFLEHKLKIQISWLVSAENCLKIKLSLWMKFKLSFYSTLSIYFFVDSGKPLPLGAFWVYSIYGSKFIKYDCLVFEQEPQSWKQYWMNDSNIWFFTIPLFNMTSVS